MPKMTPDWSHVDQSLTVWGDYVSAQVQSDGLVHLHVEPDAPRHADGLIILTEADVEALTRLLAARLLRVGFPSLRRRASDAL